VDESMTTIQETDRLLKAVEVAQILNISRSLAYRLLQEGQIPVIRINQAVRVRLRDLHQYIEQNRTGMKVFSIVE